MPTRVDDLPGVADGLNDDVSVQGPEAPADRQWLPVSCADGHGPGCAPRDPDEVS